MIDATVLEQVNDRLVELETRAAFAEDLVGELNDQVARQGAELATLTRALERVTEQLRALQGGSGADPAGSPDEQLLAERPPHY